MKCEVCLWVSGPAELHPLLMQIFAFLADFATIAGIGVAIWAGIKAYTTWKSELIGTAKFELARKILRTVSPLLESVDIFVEHTISPEHLVSLLRLMEMEQSEIEPNLVELLHQAKQLELDTEEFLKEWFAFTTPEQEIEILEEKWKPVQVALDDYKHEIFEAQYLLDDDANKLIGGVEFHIDILDDAHAHLINILSEINVTPYTHIDPELVDLMRDKYRFLFDKKRPFDLLTAVRDLEKHIGKKYLLKE